MNLSLVRLRPDMTAFYRVAARRGFLPPGDDPGYALHAALTAVFGAAAPRPFILRSTAGGAELLGYSLASADELMALSAVALGGAMVDLAMPLLMAPPEVRPMPVIWPSGLRLGFQVRVRPVVRMRPEGRGGGHREVDLYTHADIRSQTKANGTRSWPTRQEAYSMWLRERLERDGAVVVEGIALEECRRLRVLRRPRLQDGRRATVVADGPDARLAGVLSVTDGVAFGRLLAQGIGRHRSFGFGMLLVSPVGAR